MINSYKTGALILSGGKSRRMGQDKTITEFQGETFLERAIRFWKSVPDISKIYLGIGNEKHLQELKENPKTAGLLLDDGILPVTDIYPGGGPMSGIHAAFCAGDEDYLYVCAIDMLKMDAGALARPDGADAYVYAYEDKIEPLFALYSRRILGTAEAFLKDGRGKMRTLIESVNTVYLPAAGDNLDIFCNCNTPEDLKKLSNND